MLTERDRIAYGMLSGGFACGIFFALLTSGTALDRVIPRIALTVLPGALGLSLLSNDFWSDDQ
jgi:hypothetical protein